jgi:cytochrome o ubiquinol oxidase operon protein cyoD
MSGAPAHDSAIEHAGSRKDYLTGFALAVLLTAIPFWLVMGRVFSHSGITAAIIVGLAIVQIVIHMIYFLHMNTRAEGGWSLLALLFTAMLVVIALSGSIWVMYHLDHNMLPADMPEAMPGMNPGAAPMPDPRTMP